MNYYELLEVSPAASVEVIKNAYKTLAKKYHPDAYDGDKTFAEEKMKILNEAVSVLEDEAKRREYNMINGIYQTSDNYGYDGENSLNINVDENGEPIFFSYSEEFEKNEGRQKSSFMDAIDDFINNRKIKKNKADNTGESLDLEDLAETLNSNNFDEMTDTGAIRDISEMPASDDNLYDVDLYNTQDFQTVRLPGKSSGGNAPRWYYVAVACLLTGCIIMFFLVLGSLNINNIRDIIDKLSGGAAEEQTESSEPASEDIQDYSEKSIEGSTGETVTEPPEIITTENEVAADNQPVPAVTPAQTLPEAVIPAATTPPPVEATAPPPVTAATTTAPPPPETTTEPTTIEQTTQEPATEIIEETTEPEDIPPETTQEPEETTEEPTAPEPDEPDEQVTVNAGHEDVVSDPDVPANDMTEYEEIY
jgi:hypothetical protein